MERHVEPDQSYFTAVHTAIENVELDGERVLRVVKSAKIDQPDENTYAKLTGSNFQKPVGFVTIWNIRWSCTDTG